jgi:hypothetical protein
MPDKFDEDKILVGRIMSVKRVKELNAKDYFYEMLKNSPEMLKIRPGVEDEHHFQRGLPGSASYRLLD